jgi:outer membrane protein
MQTTTITSHHFASSTRCNLRASITLSALTAMAALATFATLAPQSANAADDTGPWLLRGGIASVQPASDNGRLLGGTATATVGNGVGPSIALSYFLNPNLAVDLLAALPIRHDLNLNGAHAGRVSHLPPTLSLQYHFMPAATFRPYVGLGLNYTTFMKESLDGGARLKLRDSFGLAYQAGIDYAIDRHWSIGADVRYLRIATDVRVNGADAGRLHINPVVLGLNAGYRF